tara:strand:- start:1041 stop:1292 length:252 start_codon:yes stop_codon:yes gene_type:complete
MKENKIETKEELAERLKNLKGNMNSFKNQSINFITSQQFKLIIDLENWEEQHHYGLEPEQIESVKEGMKKRQLLLNYIYNKLK